MKGFVTGNPDKGLFQGAKLVLPPHPLPAPCIEPPRADCPFYRIRKLSDRHTTANPIPELLLTAWIPAPATNSGAALTNPVERAIRPGMSLESFTLSPFLPPPFVDRLLRVERLSQEARTALSGESFEVANRRDQIASSVRRGEH